MIKFVAFDIDGTIAPNHQKASDSTIKKLLELEEKGIKVCLISGKPVDYVSGFARQLGLKNPILAGENGAVIYFGKDYPIKSEIKSSYSDEDKKILEAYIKEVENKYSSYIWLQPNKVNFSFFLKEITYKWDIYRLTEEYFTNTNFEFYLRSDNSFDIVYKGVHKGWAINQIKKSFGYGLHNFIVVGNGINDVPMFEESYFSVGIQRNDAKFKVKTIEEAFQLIDNITTEEKKCPSCGHAKIIVWNDEESKRVFGECNKCKHTSELIEFFR